MSDTIEIAAPDISILWEGGPFGGSEHARLSTTPDGHQLAGLVTTIRDGRPMTIDYRVRVDASWRTRSFSARFIDRTTKTMGGSCENGRWTLNSSDHSGERTIRDDLAGAVDIDLGWTPATNLLPVRRLGLPVGSEARLTAAWLRFPELDVVPLDQTYRRLAERRWRYSSDSFVAELEVDEHGLVSSYGDLWRATARSAPVGGSRDDA